ncbi:MAG: sulfotransferase [Acidiphilium sp.]|nr:sulfotransferase [Acidiphilium sp.]MDD4935739.1 sulfotransferase [Acidiphilium sp.]
MSQPLVIVGAPRSGTTFLCHVLNAHEDVGITNEARIFADLKQRLDPGAARDDLIGRDFQPQWLEFQRHHAGRWIEQFYREVLGIRTRIWGDKHPPYADPTILSGRNNAVPHPPQSGSCLGLINEVLPATKFIHIHRHPARVALSLARKGWIDSFEAGLGIWQQYITEIDRFFSQLPADRQLTIAHHDLLAEPDGSSHAIARFLDLSDAGPIARFLHAQRRAPTPFSEPMSVLGSARSPVSSREKRLAARQLGALAAQFGYAEPARVAA